MTKCWDQRSQHSKPVFSFSLETVVQYFLDQCLCWYHRTWLLQISAFDYVGIYICIYTCTHKCIHMYNYLLFKIYFAKCRYLKINYSFKFRKFYKTKQKRPTLNSNFHIEIMHHQYWKYICRRIQCIHFSLFKLMLQSLFKAQLFYFTFKFTKYGKITYLVIIHTLYIHILS